MAARTAQPGSSWCAQSPKPARVGKLLDVRERERDAFLGSGEAERAKSGGVDEHAAVGQRDQLTRDRRVTPALVADADRAGFLPLPSHQGVHDRRLPCSGGPEQDGGAVPGHVVEQGRDVLARERVHRPRHRRRARSTRRPRARRPGRADRSALVRTTTGTAPESHASASSRSMRRTLGGSAIG